MMKAVRACSEGARVHPYVVKKGVSVYHSRKGFIQPRYHLPEVIARRRVLDMRLPCSARQDNQGSGTFISLKYQRTVGVNEPLLL